MKIRYCPATVKGMHTVFTHCSKGWEGTVNVTPKVRKPAQNIYPVEDFDAKDLIINTEIYNHQFVNREAIVKSVPTAFETEIKPGDIVITHHNVFRRWHNQYGIEKNSRSYFNENTYLVKPDQIFLYKRNNNWVAIDGYCFVQPIKDVDKFNDSIKIS